MNNQPLLEVRNLKVEIPTRKGTLIALEDVSFNLKAGEILGVVGESGAGKSMVGNSIIGLLGKPAHITHGEILLEGKRIDNLSDDEMEKIRGKNIGAIFQDPLTSLNPLFTIGDQLIETIRIHSDLSEKEARERAIRLLVATGVPAADKRMDNYPHQFSGGMRQRVVIALALSADPKLIIADEPTTALDVSVQAQIIELLKKLCEENGTAVILVTHDMGVIAEAADRVAVMYAGRLVELADKRTLFNEPRHPYTRMLLDAIPDLSQTHRRRTPISGEVPNPLSPPTGCPFHPRCPLANERCRKEMPLRQMIDSHGSFSEVACHAAEEGRL
ncbi:MULTISPECIES: ABC transporter ATP-binding protein [Parasutterella]|uniref:ABC transporter ATP-binding protein n=1 Tax=Parasutterella TaxID=577310 RepID=UPI000623B4C4|nr:MULTISPECIES: ABC transporter ATP-binding protein [Parasutterella]